MAENVTINIDMDKKCEKCGKAGVAGASGLCLNCAAGAKAARLSEKYELSVRIESIARDLIKMHHPHLAGARIAYLMKKVQVDENGEAKPVKPTRAGKKIARGKARSVNELYYALTGLDFVIEIEESYWDGLEIEEQVALVDHELCHCAVDEKGWYIKDHDVEEFVDVVYRHGFWRDEIRQLTQAAQLHLPFDEPPAEQQSKVH